MVLAKFQDLAACWAASEHANGSPLDPANQVIAYTRDAVLL
jgi:hypothetical protein